MYQLKSDSITAIYPDSWPTWSFVKTDDCTYKDNGWNGCDYRVSDGNADGLAINIHITGKDSKWNGTTFETRARIEFVGDGEPSTFAKGKVYSTSHLFTYASDGVKTELIKKFKVEFMDFTAIGGHGSYLMRVKAGSKQEAEKKVLAAHRSAWDINAVLVA